jgi:hypothetical protein
MVEKMFNRLGYCGIASAASIGEAWDLNQYKSHSFDLLVINVRLLAHPLVTTLLHPKASGIHNLLVFGFHERPGEPFAGVIDHLAVELMPGLPEYPRMVSFMAGIESHQRVT